MTSARPLPPHRRHAPERSPSFRRQRTPRMRSARRAEERLLGPLGTRTARAAVWRKRGEEEEVLPCTGRFHFRAGGQVFLRSSAMLGWT